uniref:C2 domain-containing protein n=1 Tax=Oncorhynchus kisutch TaxID=8019 RepID=A0A8C7C529_ONCKI
MWFLGKIRETKASLSNKLHSNILTPDKIPEFCLPPRLCRSLAAAEPHTVSQRGKKPLPFSAEGYGLAGLYESPNTRRKESLFHSKSTGYTLDRTLPRPTTRVAIDLSESGSTESDTPSSNDSSPLGSPLLSRSCSGLSLSIIGLTEGHPGLQSPCFSPPFVVNSLVPPVLFPLDVLHCQERMQREHVLPLPEGRGRVRLSAEHTLSPSLLSMVVRVRVVSVEGLRDEGDPRALHCCLSLSLSPGKLQRQDSATIRNCRSPVFNEDFFFTELSLDSLGGLRLQLKVLDKASGLRRGTVQPLYVLLLCPWPGLFPDHVT